MIVLPDAAEDVPSRSDAKKFVGRSCLVVVAGLLVREIGVWHPDVLDKLGADRKRLYAEIAVIRHARIAPELPEEKVDREVLWTGLF